MCYYVACVASTCAHAHHSTYLLPSSSTKENSVASTTIGAGLHPHDINNQLDLLASVFSKSWHNIMVK